MPSPICFDIFSWALWKIVWPWNPTISTSTPAFFIISLLILTWNNVIFLSSSLIYSDLLNLRDKINSIKDLKANSYQINELERKITLFHAKISKEIIKNAGVDVDIVGFHGQTIFHNAQEKISKQIGDGNLLSSLLKENVVYNFRENDIHNGGQGAPLAPIFHNLLVNQNKIEKPACVLNIGGIANITLVISIWFWLTSKLWKIGANGAPCPPLRMSLSLKL